MGGKKKKEEPRAKVKSIDIVKTTRDLTEEQIYSAIRLIEEAKKDGYRITQISFM